MNPQILICGAGPTGLVLAIWLTKRNIPVRIIDKAAAAGTASRALVIHARTLELYRMMGLDAAVVGGAHPFGQARLWVKKKLAGTVRFGGVATNTTPFPYVLVFPQDEHEAMLEAELGRLGVRVERNTELLALEDCRGGVRVQLRGPDGAVENAAFSWLTGCDGARSRVRELIGAGFPGGTYEHTFYVADITGSGPVVNGDLNIALDDADFLAVFPLKGEGRARLIGTVVEGAADRRRPGVMGGSPSDRHRPAVLPRMRTEEERPLQWGDVSKDIFRRIALNIEQVNWFSTYRVHHRVANFFRKGRVFILGDAGHVHSPLGGQGMNTGIGDAVNLAWKLEAVLRCGAPDSILDTFQTERIGFARKLVATTDRAFMFVNRKSALATAVRTRLLPVLLPPIFHSKLVRRLIFRLISQTRINYRKMPLSTGVRHHLHSGDRLPWLCRQDNYAPLSSMDWQLHCYGEVSQELRKWCDGRQVALHSFLPAAPISLGTLCLVRPDGYIGWLGRTTDLVELTRYVTQWRIA